MILEIFTENEYLKNKYSEIKLNYVSDSGFDLYVPETVEIPAKAISYKLNLNVKCRMFTEQSTYKPYLLFPRSSMGAKTPLRLGNSIGLIDKDYRGDIIMIIDNLSEKPFTVEQGARLGQIVAFSGEPFGFDLISEIDETERGEGGLGSTGK